jgi:hypothetical protein
MAQREKMIALILNVIKFTLGIVGAILCLMIMVGSSEVDAAGDPKASPMIGPALMLAIIVTIAIISCVVLFGIYHLINKGKKAIPFLITLVAFLVLVGISYAMGDGEVSAKWLALKQEAMVANPADTLPTDGEKLFAGQAIMGIFIFAIVAVATVIFAEVSKLFK